MKKNLKKLLIAASVLVSFANLSSGKTIFAENFDSQLADEGSPDNFFSFGTSLTSIVVNSRNPNSAPNSAIITLDMTDGWGGGMVRRKFEPTDFTGAIISASISASQDLKDNKVMAFRVEDEDGTIMRANISKMFAPSTAYSTFEVPIAHLTQIDARGADSILDVKKIVSYGMCFYNNNNVSGVVHFYIDDLEVIDSAGTEDDVISITKSGR